MTRLTMLSSMASPDFIEALDRHAAWGLSDVDLKDRIFGKEILDLTPEEACRAAGELKARGLTVECLSTGMLLMPMEEGEVAFRQAFLPQLDRAVRLAHILGARSVRLLSARTKRRAALRDAVACARAECPWLIPLYREFVDRLHDAGLEARIENEVSGNLFSTPAEITQFFEALDRPEKASLTWDIANLWQEGTFPSLPVYRQLKPYIGYVHLKGGYGEVAGGPLQGASTLAEASWPVREIMTEVVRDRVSPVLCLNPPHGRPRAGAPPGDTTRLDLEFMKALLARLSGEAAGEAA